MRVLCPQSLVGFAIVISGGGVVVVGVKANGYAVHDIPLLSVWQKKKGGMGSSNTPELTAIKGGFCEMSP